jgi:hypothetical protein
MRTFLSRTLPIAIGASLILLPGVADATSTTCSTSTVCAEYINTSSGVAIHGEANTGIGIRGTSNSSTGFYGATRSGSTFFPGVEGESLDQSGSDAAGGFGLSAYGGAGPAPAYGVLAYGSVFGVYGQTSGAGNSSHGLPSGVGLFGYDTAGAAGLDTNVAVFGQTTHGTSMLALANVPYSSSYAFQDSVPYGVAAEAEPETSGGSAVAVDAYSTSIALEAYNPTHGIEVDLATPEYYIDANGFSVAQNDVNAKSLMTRYGTYLRTTGSSGTARIAYSTRNAAPVMEDSGEAELVNGRGYVELDPVLFDVIDKRVAYRVFLTAEGDNKGLYVKQKSPAGFSVRESRGGHSTLSFDYRIVAKPVDDDGTRLALAPPLRTSELEHVHLRSAHPATPQEPLDPFARSKARIGLAAYARERKAAKAIEAGL